MATLTYRTAGESHGPAISALIEGMPAGVTVDESLINAELRRRQGGYGRGGRQKIETDTVQIMSGVRQGRTIGSPILLQIINKDSRLDDAPPVHRPRPGHADLAGSLKWLTTDCRPVLERASARETAARVAAGALARCLLNEFQISVFAYVLAIGDVTATIDWTPFEKAHGPQSVGPLLDSLRAARDAGDLFREWVGCPDPDASARMRDAIKKVKIEGDTLGGLVEARVFNCPPGLGTCVQYDQRLDARLAMAVMGIQAFKSVEIGMGKDVAYLPGSKVHDEIGFDPSQKDSLSLGFTRQTNNAGGLEGGMTNGQPLIIRGAKKPISTLMKPLGSVDLNTKEVSKAAYERSDACAVPAASVIMEAVVAFEVARAMIEKFAGDSLTEMRANYTNYLSLARQLPL
ncbi:MAG TPA: chorismate synthase [Tepidisphaeraceae bacterium]|jgi:chorismate synthase|nr:chorismate synthase [Tepidisphaeraceae bacterium]